MSNAANATAFSQYAGAYAQHRPTYPPALWDRAAELCAEHGQAWDVGCGNGQAAVGLAEKFAHVTATDISAEQIAAAMPHPRVRYAAVAAENVQIAPGSVDLVCVAQALHWFDLQKFWPLVQRALKPRGVFLAVAYGLFNVHTAIDAVTERYFYKVVNGYQSAGNIAVAQGYKDFVFPFEMVTPPALHIHMDWSLDQLLNYAATWSAVARIRKEAGFDPMPIYRAALAPLWGDTARTVRMPLTIKAGFKPA